MGVFTVSHDGHDKKERLYRWLGQQKNIFQVTSTPSGGGKGVPSVQQFVPLTPTVEPPVFAKKSSPQVSPSVQLTEPLLRPVLVKNKTSKSSNVLSSSSGNSSGDSPTTKDTSRKTSKTFKLSSQSNSEQKNSSVYFIHPELQKEEKSRMTTENKKQKKRSLDSCQNSMYGPYSLPLVHQVEPAYYGQLYHRRQPKIYPYHQQEMYTHYFPPSAYHSLPCPKHHRPYMIHQRPPMSHPHQQPPIYYRPNMMPQMTNSYPLTELNTMPKDRRKVSDIYVSSLVENAKLKKKDKKKRRKEKRKKEEERVKRRNMPLTDEQIDSSYTGLDREIAEGFITLTMEPARSDRKSGVSTSDDQESF